MSPSTWLTVIGIGEGGLPDMTPAARACLRQATLVIGGERHLALAAEDIAGVEHRTWTNLEDTVAAVLARRGQPTVVLASGDPMHYGFAATLSHKLAPGDMTVLPHLSAFCLAAARLCWPVQDIACLSAHGRPIEALAPHVHDGARLLILSADGRTPAAVAALLERLDFAPSTLTVLEHLGGPQEKTFVWSPGTPCADLNTLAVECRAAPGALGLSRVPGLPDGAFTHDGQLTKREARAVTLSLLAPRPGELLWDVGAGSGSIAIEWLRAVPHTRVVAFERDPTRLATVQANALTLGVPSLIAVGGEAPAVLADFAEDPPHAVFVGGGLSRLGETLLDAAWGYLRPGGRLVANAVTKDSQAALTAFHARRGGTMTRLQVSRLLPSGGWDDRSPLLHYLGSKP